MQIAFIITQHPRESCPRKPGIIARYNIPFSGPIRKFTPVYHFKGVSIGVPAIEMSFHGRDDETQECAILGSKSRLEVIIDSVVVGLFC